MSDSSASAWWYLQIFLQEPARPGQVLGELPQAFDALLSPMLRDCIRSLSAAKAIEQFFFIRYGEQGYHLRLRIKAAPSALRDQIQPAVEELALRFFERYHALLGLPDQLPTLAGLRAAGRLRYPLYEPEYAKYGGPRGLALAEWHHQLSSELALQILDAERQTTIARSQFVLELIKIMLVIFGANPQEQAFLLSAYTCYWLGLVDQQRGDVVERMEATYQRNKQRLLRRFEDERQGALEASAAGLSTSIFERWRSHLSSHLAELRELERSGLLETPLAGHVAQHQALLGQVPAVAAHPTIALLILPNYLHMLSNRLGLSPLHEIQLTHQLCRLLEDRHGLVAGAYPLVLEPALLS